MDYNTSGIVYRIFAVYGIIFILGIVCLLLSKFSKNTPKKTEFIIAVIMILFSLVNIGTHIYRAVHPSVLINEGCFIEEYRDSREAPPLPFTYKYVFTSSTSDKKQAFYLDTFSKKNICPDGFLTEEGYRIFYEKNTNIILKVEKIS